jgi:hypothetical protein
MQLLEAQWVTVVGSACSVLNLTTGVYSSHRRANVSTAPPKALRPTRKERLRTKSGHGKPRDCVRATSFGRSHDCLRTGGRSVPYATLTEGAAFGRLLQNFNRRRPLRRGAKSPLNSERVPQNRYGAQGTPGSVHSRVQPCQFPVLRTYSVLHYPPPKDRNLLERGGCSRISSYLNSHGLRPRRNRRGRVATCGRRVTQLV